jgi:flagellar motor component MotA
MELKRKKLLEDKLRKMVREELLQEADGGRPNAMVAKAIMTLCRDYLSGASSNGVFVQQIKLQIKNLK